jgi:hypothetical protein
MTEPPSVLVVTPTTGQSRLRYSPANSWPGGRADRSTGKPGCPARRSASMEIPQEARDYFRNLGRQHADEEKKTNPEGVAERNRAIQRIVRYPRW